MSASKAKEEKKYVQLSPDTVSMLAESIGISQNGLSANVSRALAEDVSYRCRELANVRILSYVHIFSSYALPIEFYLH